MYHRPNNKKTIGRLKENRQLMSTQIKATFFFPFFSLNING